MRTFGTKITNFFEFKLEGYDTVYRIPLAPEVPYTILNKLYAESASRESFNKQIEMLRKYMGDVVDELSAATLTDILQAWMEESNSTGITVGES